MMKFIFRISAAILLFSACETELDISKIGLNRRLVVNAVLNNTDPVKIFISRTAGLFDSTRPDPVQGANVVLYNKSGNPVAACTYNIISENYESSFIPVSGEEYEIRVVAADYPQATAFLKIPEAASNKKPFWKDSTSLDSFGFPQGTLNVYINDKGSVKNYYRITIYYYDDLLAEWYALKPALIDAEIQNQSIKTEDGGIIFTDAGFNGKEKEIGFITQFAYSQQSPKFLIVTENLSEAYYLYFKSLDEYRNSGGVFSEPTAIYTNIKNGIGIAAGSSIQRDTIQ